MQGKVVKVFALSLGPVRCFPRWPKSQPYFLVPNDVPVTIFKSILVSIKSEH